MCTRITISRDKLIQIKAPPGVGKTIIAAYSMMRDPRFSRRKTPLFIVATTPTIEYWFRELSFIFPSTSIARVHSGKGGVPRLSLVSELSKDKPSIGIVIANVSFYSRYYINNPIGSIEYVIIDEAHRRGGTALFIQSIIAQESLKKGYLLSANTIKQMIPITSIEETVCSAEEIPSTKDFCHGFLDDWKSVKTYEYDTIVSKCLSKVDSREPDKHVVIFLGKLPSRKDKQTISGYKVNYASRGANLDSDIATFSKSKGHNVILLSYKSCCTAISVKANDIFLILDKGYGPETLYQARRRALRLSSTVKTVNVHYVAEKTYQARVGCTIARIFSETMKEVSIIYRIMTNAETVAKNIGVDLDTCSERALLYIIHPRDKNPDVCKLAFDETEASIREDYHRYINNH
jgi:hypothetical protein